MTRRTAAVCPMQQASSRHSSSIIISYTIKPSEERQLYHRTIFYIPIPSLLQQQNHSSSSIISLLTQPVFCRGSRFDLELVVDKEDGDENNDSENKNNNKNNTFATVAEFYSPNPTITADAIVSRLKVRLEDLISIYIHRNNNDKNTTKRNKTKMKKKNQKNLKTDSLISSSSSMTLNSFTQYHESSIHHHHHHDSFRSSTKQQHSSCMSCVNPLQANDICTIS